MRLTELDARFICRLKRGGLRYVKSLARAQGIIFDCPKCHLTGHDHKVVCWFRNPRTGKPVPDDVQPGPGRWWIEGSSLNDLSFTEGKPPQAKSVQFHAGCQWHGYVTKGDTLTL